MKRVLLFLITAQLFLVFSCSEKQQEKAQNIETEKTAIDSIYLTNGEGDTIPTGEPVPALQPFDFPDKLDNNAKFLTGKEIINLDWDGNLRTTKTVVNKDVAAPNIVRSNRFYIDSGFNYTPGKDTFPPLDTSHALPDLIKISNGEQFKSGAPIFRDAANRDIQNLSIDQGLISNSINDLLIDSRNWIWIATDIGLMRFDGVFCKSYNSKNGLPSDYINSITEDKEGNIWMTFFGDGFGKFDGKELTYYSRKNSVLSGYTTDILVDKNDKVWISTFGGGLMILEEDVLSYYGKKEGLAIYKWTGSLNEDSKGRLWFSNFGRGVWVKDKNGMRQLSKSAGVPSRWLTDVFHASDGRMFFGGVTSNVYEFEDDRVRELKFSGDTKNYTQCFAEDKEGRIWVGTTTEGLYIYDDDKVTNINMDDGLASNSVTTIVMDPSGRMWVGTSDGGISLINPNSFTFYVTSTGLPSNSVNSIFQGDDEEILLSSSQGLVSIRDTVITHFHGAFRHKGYESAALNCFDFVKNKTGGYFGAVQNYGNFTFKGDQVWKFGGNQSGMMQNPGGAAVDKNGFFYAVNGDGRSRILVFSDTGINRYDWQQNFVLSNGSEIKAFDDGIWVGSETEGICHFDGEFFTYYTTNEGLPSQHVNHISKDVEGRT